MWKFILSLHKKKFRCQLCRYRCSFGMKIKYKGSIRKNIGTDASQNSHLRDEVPQIHGIFVKFLRSPRMSLGPLYQGITALSLLISMNKIGISSSSSHKNSFLRAFYKLAVILIFFLKSSTPNSFLDSNSRNQWTNKTLSPKKNLKQTPEQSSQNLLKTVVLILLSIYLVAKPFFF